MTQKEKAANLQIPEAETTDEFIKFLSADQLINQKFINTHLADLKHSVHYVQKF